MTSDNCIIGMQKMLFKRNNKEYRVFDDLPMKLQKEIKLLGVSDVENFITNPIMSLNNQSLIQIINENKDDNGYKIVLEHVRYLQGKVL